MKRIIGLDPGLRYTGWGIIEANDAGRLRYVADGVIKTKTDQEFGQRLYQIETQLQEIITHYKPDEAAIEHIFLNKNPVSTLKLGMARGICLLVPAKCGLLAKEYPANLIKKSVVGVGHADKDQVEAMVKILLPGAKMERSDAADALAIAICHSHHRRTELLLGGVMSGGYAGGRKTL